MNMRAAEASVSRAPEAMHISPISEVWSQPELSLLAITRGADAAAASAEDIASVVCWGGGSSRNARSTSLS